jgi:hypothetical protein
MTAIRGVRPQTGRHATPLSAYFWLLLFITLYFLRPEEWIPGLAVIPVEKITGLLALAGFGLGLLVSSQRFRHMPRETLYLILLFGQLCLTIPFALWRGGSFHVVFYVFVKVVLISIAIALAVDTWPQLRRLLFVQACAVPVLAAAALARHQTDREGRLVGVGHAFDNANDFSFLISLTLPLCFAFLLSTRRPLAKAAWVLAMATMGAAIMLTASRQGLMAAAISLGFCLWEFGIKGRRVYLVLLATVVAVGVLAVARPGRLMKRVASTFADADSSTYESTQIRKMILKESLAAALEHPLFGVGPGNFTVISGVWRVAHNSFTEMAAEGGLPALILFLMILYRGLANVASLKRGPTDKESDMKLLATALQASLVTFVIGGLFSSWEYQYMPYLLVAYSTAFYRIAGPQQTPKPGSVGAPKWGKSYLRYQGQRTSSRAWSAS